MEDRIYLDHPYVHILAEYDARDGGRALYVVCEDHGDAEYAARLAAALGVPLCYGSGPPPAVSQQPRSATA